MDRQTYWNKHKSWTDRLTETETQTQNLGLLKQTNTKLEYTYLLKQTNAKLVQTSLPKQTNTKHGQMYLWKDRQRQSLDLLKQTQNLDRSGTSNMNMTRSAD